MNDSLALAIEWALEMAESFEAAARNPDKKPMAKPLRDAVWIRLDGELQHAGMDMETALRMYAEERRQLSNRQFEEEKN